MRVSGLALRPMHSDEAVNAVKFGALLEKGEFIYDRNEYHGPSLFYLTLFPSWLTHTTEFGDLTEIYLRILPALAGIFLIGLFAVLRNWLDWKVIASGALIAAISPALVFYSRYFIHEMLLVFFTYGLVFSMFRFFRAPGIKWLTIAAVFLGFMYATKETFFLALVGIIVALMLDQMLWNNKCIKIRQVFRSVKIYHIILFLFVFSLISVLLFSSFFQNPRGILDSILTYRDYMGKAGENGFHRHPWYYYLKILIWNKGPGMIYWSELPVLILSIFGIILVFLNKTRQLSVQFLRIVALFSLLLLVIYSIIPYKTPWNLLNFYFGLIILAGYGAWELMRHLKNQWARIILWSAYVFVGTYLIMQDVYGNFIQSADPSNPYVYAHTSADLLNLTGRIGELTDVHPDGKLMTIHVICTNHDYWPLPWYLREYPNVGWWDRIDPEIPLAPLIIISPDLENDLVRKMYTLPEPGKKYLYVPLLEAGTELRPGTGILSYVRMDYFDLMR